MKKFITLTITTVIVSLILLVLGAANAESYHQKLIPNTDEEKFYEVENDGEIYLFTEDFSTGYRWNTHHSFTPNMRVFWKPCFPVFDHNALENAEDFFDEILNEDGTKTLKKSLAASNLVDEQTLLEIVYDGQTYIVTYNYKQIFRWNTMLPYFPEMHVYPSNSLIIDDFGELGDFFEVEEITPQVVELAPIAA